MKTPPRILRGTVKSFKEQGFDFYVSINVLKEIDTTTEKVWVKVTPLQLSKAVYKGNTKDEVIIDAKFGRNGKKAAYIIEVPCF